MRSALHGAGHRRRHLRQALQQLSLIGG